MSNTATNSIELITAVRFTEVVRTISDNSISGRMKMALKKTVMLPQRVDECLKEVEENSQSLIWMFSPGAGSGKLYAA